jgi:hypothetical protein
MFSEKLTTKSVKKMGFKLRTLWKIYFELKRLERDRKIYGVGS